MVLIDGQAGERCYDPRIEYDGPSSALARRLLEKRFEEYIVRAGGPSELTDVASPVPLTVTLAHGQGERAEALQPQGYLLEIRPDRILCAGKDNAGVVNAVASLLQLAHVRDGKLVARCASVRDWPTFLTRYTAEYSLPGPEFFDWMMLYKINGFAACYPGMRWEGNGGSKREALKVIGDYIEQYRTLSFMAEFHVGGRSGPPVDCGNPDNVEQFLATIRETVELSRASQIMVCYDDVVPKLQPAERGRFDSPAQAHGFLMERVYDTVKGLAPEAIVSFCTPYYQGRGHRGWQGEKSRIRGLEYLGGVRAWKNKDIRIVWTGPVTESREITREDIESYLEWVGTDRKLFYWDNTWHYHQPLRNFHARYPEDFVDFCADRTAYVNINGTTPIGKFFSVTANDYYWNPEAFDSKRSRRQAVTQFMGADAVPAAEGLYDIRGDDYYVFFVRDVNLPELRLAMSKLERRSLDPEIPKVCWGAFSAMVRKRGVGQGGCP